MTYFFDKYFGDIIRLINRRKQQAPIKNGLGPYLKGIRIKSGKTLAMISDSIGISITGISNFENNKGIIPHDKIIKLCNALEVENIDLIMNYEDYAQVLMDLYLNEENHIKTDVCIDDFSSSPILLFGFLLYYKKYDKAYELFESLVITARSAQINEFNLFIFLCSQMLFNLGEIYNAFYILHKMIPQCDKQEMLKCKYLMRYSSIVHNPHYILEEYSDIIRKYANKGLYDFVTTINYEKLKYLSRYLNHESFLIQMKDVPTLSEDEENRLLIHYYAYNEEYLNAYHRIIKINDPTNQDTIWRLILAHRTDNKDDVKKILNSDFNTQNVTYIMLFNFFTNLYFKKEEADLSVISDLTRNIEFIDEIFILDFIFKEAKGIYVKTKNYRQLSELIEKISFKEQSLMDYNKTDYEKKKTKPLTNKSKIHFT